MSQKINAPHRTRRGCCGEGDEVVVQVLMVRRDVCRV